MKEAEQNVTEITSVETIGMDARRVPHFSRVLGARSGDSCLLEIHSGEGHRNPTAAGTTF
jgi:hypothetical protein